MSLKGLDLFQLLPALYRLKDSQVAQSQALLTPVEQTQLAALQALIPPLSADQQAELDELTAKAARGPLQSLLMLVEEQLAVLSENLDQLYDDQFIETCARWVIPYIGDLIGYRAVKGIAPAVASPRAEVAHTISFRRRKGTVPVMEQLARDVTGWPAHAVEFFKVLMDSQYMNHIRLYNHYSPDLRQWKPGLYMDSGFDRTAHSVDVRRIASGRGRYNIQNIGIFLWSLHAYRLSQSPCIPVPLNPQCFRLSPLGQDIPLFNNPRPQGQTITALAEPVNVPDRLRRRVLCNDLQGGAGSSYYGEGNSLAIYVNNTLLNAYEIQVCDLSGVDGSWNNLPAAGSLFKAAIDPELGRIAVPPGSPAPDVRASFYYGFNADMGGGEYPRASTFTVENEAQVFPFPDTASTPRYSTLQDAVAFAVAQLTTSGGAAAVEIIDSQIYPAAGSPALALDIDLPTGATLELRAADSHRPTLILSDEIAITGAASTTFTLNGIVVSSSAAPGSPSPTALLHAPALRPDGSTNLLSQLELTHTTLVPGWALTPAGLPVHGDQPALVAEPAGLQILVQKSILGALRTNELVTANLSDSIVDATSRTNVAYSAPDGLSGGGSLTMIGCTVIGKVHATLLDLISNTIFWAGLAAGDTWKAPLLADRKQAGCVRFSFLPPHAVTPRQFECVEQAPGSPQPLFFSLRYGDPPYAKLLTATDDAIRRGADDGGEMGAFHFVLAPLRETDLLVRLQEYVPAGLEFGIIYEN
ncbi:MAG TPA: hypothetical protein VHA06_02505 [Candidatus Angelobacter sp.]|nr:hypothetical protein [Candidatus Angelobacter sp.]